MFVRAIVCSTALCVGCALAGSARADEVFACEDGKLIRVTSENRLEMYEHPCVKAWFAMNSARDTARARAADRRDAPPQLLPRTLSRSAQWLVFSGRDRWRHPTPTDPVVSRATARAVATVGPSPYRQSARQAAPRIPRIRFRRR